MAARIESIAAGDIIIPPPELMPGIPGVFPAPFDVSAVAAPAEPPAS
jgi:hypothetical protein